MLTAAHCPMKLTLDDALYMAQRFDYCLGGVEDYVTQMREANPAVKLYGYVKLAQPLDSWARSIFGSVLGESLANPSVGCANYVAHYGFDGLFIDCPFSYSDDWHATLKLLCDIETAIAPAHCMINFGDVATYASSMEANQLAFNCAIMFKQHFVQVSERTDSFYAPSWEHYHDLINKRAEGNLVVAGIYDPNGTRPWLARGIDLSLSEKVVRHYATAVPPAVGGPQTQWNPFWVER